MNTDHESVLQFVINLSVELGRLGAKVENMSAKVDNLANAVEGIGETVGDLDVKSQLNDKNTDTTAKLLDYILKEIQALKMFKTDVSVVAVQADGLSEEELKQRVTDAVNEGRQEGAEVPESPAREEEGGQYSIRNGSTGEITECEKECEEEACEEGQACQKTI